MKKFSVYILFFSLLFNCSSNESTNDNPIDLFVVNDYSLAMDENPTENQLIGIIPYEVNKGLGGVRFFITSQNVSNAIYLLEASIYINNPILFDFETNPIIIANLKVERGYWYEYFWRTLHTKTITVTINLNDLPD